MTAPGWTCPTCAATVPEPSTPMPRDDRASEWDDYASALTLHERGDCESGQRVWPGVDVEARLAPYVVAPNGGRR